jgi:soluble lytic murein transglycosylase
MVTSGVRAGIILASLLAVAASAQDTLDPYRGQMAQMPPTQTIQAVQAAPEDGSIAATIAQWRALQQTDALPFDSYASFLMAHPGWPGEASNRRAAERQAVAGTGSPGNVAAYFRRSPPTTGQGWLADARALAGTGQPAAAADAARKAWRSTSLGPNDESYILTSFPGALTSDDHDARADALLWAGQASAAARVLPLTSAARRPVLTARLSLRGNAPDAASVAAANAFSNDAGFTAARAAWLKDSGQWDAARQALAATPRLAATPSNPAVWLDTLIANARAAAADHQWQTAYDIAAHVDDAYPIGTDVGDRSYGERDAYTDLAWLAGQTALKQLGRPGDAATLFDRYARGSHSPPIRAKGFYWAGRAAEAAGRSVEAMGYFADAAGFRDQFYGQLAAERMGKVLSAPPAVGPATVDPTVRAAFDRREVVRAARFLGRIGDHDDQTPFVRQIAQDAKSDTDHLLAAELSVQIGRPDLGVMVGRSALVNGLSDYSAAGFPMMPVPAGYEGSWTIIHAISRQESQFDRAAVSHAGARGLMQLMPGTAREQSGKIGVAYTSASLTSDPQLSMMLGSSYFQRIYNQFASYPLAIAAYNAGAGNVNKWLAANGDPRMGSVDMVDWIEAIPFSETRGYVQRVLENAVVYDLLNPQRALSGGRPAPLSWYLGKGKPG